MPKKPKISIREAEEIMTLYYKITDGQKITTEDKLLSVHRLLTQYVEKKTKSPQIHF